MSVDMMMEFKPIVRKTNIMQRKLKTQIVPDKMLTDNTIQSYVIKRTLGRGFKRSSITHSTLLDNMQVLLSCTKGRKVDYILIIIILVLNVLRLLLYINCYLLLMYSLELPKTCLVAEEGALHTCIPQTVYIYHLDDRKEKGSNCMIGFKWDCCLISYHICPVGSNKPEFDDYRVLFYYS